MPALENTSSFGYWIRRRRKALDLTQSELARMVGCALPTIKKIELDERRPSLQMAERLANCLEIPLAERVVFFKVARQVYSPERFERQKKLELGKPVITRTWVNQHEIMPGQALDDELAIKPGGFAVDSEATNPPDFGG